MLEPKKLDDEQICMLVSLPFILPLMIMFIKRYIEIIYLVAK